MVKDSENRNLLRRAFVWKSINWAKVQRYVFKLQKRIYQAAKSGQDAKARRLQRLLVKSYYACETFRGEIGMQCPK
ncbi:MULTISPECIES: reverse transcriptase N-terminal domain-containing protein [Limnospira]|uniref:reverse transcriptase N-terminal domain-containing protein n=1 Tax=Limnospira TaxID=2596745 RepID=UPI0003032E52|nr:MULTISPECIES: reverse transcriptase N-terminal domain-containing protein [Limnospira]MDT9190660.1 reverse transcriptase N-terminal domain-containing protein [Limnospira sp. PMC 894.15]MDT9236583.1 reverse transcriptase N-terminal domain-containing protein [Limnospira sp. PMC 917.15]